MKITQFIFLLFFLLLSLATFAQNEHIKNFDVKVVVDKDRSILVTEMITVYAAGRSIKRGITRNFPASRIMNDRSVGVKYQIQDIERDGKDEPYFTKEEGNDFTIYIGRKEVFLEPGFYTYKIEYRVPNQIGFFEKYDEIYWNAIGTDVSFPVEKASCEVVLPPNASVIQQAAYIGGYGSTEQPGETRFESGRGFYSPGRSLKPKEAFTVAIGFQKDLVEPPTYFEQHGTLLVILLGLLILLPYYFLTWFRYGQDPPTPASYPQWNSPDGLSAASINYISKETYQTEGFTASIIDLAVKGFLRIEEREGKGLIFKTKAYDLIKLKNADDSLPIEEKQLFTSLFSNRTKINIDGEYQSHIENAYNNHYANVRHQHLSFVMEGNNFQFVILPLLISIAVGGLAVLLFSKNPYAEGVNITYIIIFGILALIGVILYTYLIKQPTVDKLDLQSRINGFQMYLDLAEKERLNLLNPPDMTTEHFEAMLPYAFALGVEHKWSEKFKAILEAAQYRPEWSNSSTVYYSSNNFGSSFSKSVSSSSTKPPESSSGGGSGGGGFSGGGGGGGGVGGW